jgi:hypothetical protein
MVSEVEEKSGRTIKKGDVKENFYRMGKSTKKHLYVDVVRCGVCSMKLLRNRRESVYGTRRRT